jgi:hypothetical protein
MTWGQRCDLHLCAAGQGHQVLSNKFRRWDEISALFSINQLRRYHPCNWSGPAHRDHAVALLQARHALGGFLHDAHELMARDVAEIGNFAAEDVQVGAAVAVAVTRSNTSSSCSSNGSGTKSSDSDL